MSDIDRQIDLIQSWLNTLRQDQPTDPSQQKSVELLLEQILNLIQHGIVQEQSTQSMSQTYDDWKIQVQEHTNTLRHATHILKAKINERKTTVKNIQTAYDNLEIHLQEHLVYQSGLNQKLQDKINEQQHKQRLDKQEQALTNALRNTLSTMSQTLDLNKILDQILDTIEQVTPYDGANIILIKSDLVHIARKKGYISADSQDTCNNNQRIPLKQMIVLQQLMAIGKPLAISDISKSSMWIGFPNLKWISSNVIVPIRSNRRIIGFLSLDSATRGYFTQEHTERLQSFADQIAIAIQNTRLLIRAKRSAVLAERNRMANELHDTISQTLWSMSLVTERLPAIWENDKDEGRRGLATLHQLTQNALTEMRSLLLELHPSSLTNAKLGELIQQVTEVIANRTGLKIFIQINDQDPIPPKVHFALYRVIQEALNNIAQHALASRVDIHFSNYLGKIDLTIQDDGQGFDPSQVDSGHLGLSIMADRIQTVGGTIEILSQTGLGTQVKIIWKASTN